jgi:hypothetical protein
MREMGSLPLLPLELDVADDVAPPMHELMASLSFPPDTLPSSQKGENRMCKGVLLPMFTVAGSLRVFKGTSADLVSLVTIISYGLNPSETSF